MYPKSYVILLVLGLPGETYTTCHVLHLHTNTATSATSDSTVFFHSRWGPAEQIDIVAVPIHIAHLLYQVLFVFKDNYFRAIEVNGKIKEMVQRFPIHAPLLLTMHSFLYQQCPLWADAFVTIMNVHGHIIIPQSSWLTLAFALGVLYSMGKVNG